MEAYRQQLPRSGKEKPREDEFNTRPGDLAVIPT